MSVLPNQPIDNSGVEASNSLYGSMDYLKYPTVFDALTELNHVDICVAYKRSKEKLCCPFCGADTFSVLWKEAELVCTGCAHAFSQQELFSLVSEKPSRLNEQSVAREEESQTDWRFDVKSKTLHFGARSKLNDSLIQWIRWNIPYNKVETVTFEAGITEIGERAFADFSKLTEVKLPVGLVGIGRSSFMRCNSLKSLLIPLSVTNIGEKAFYACAGLQYINLPNGLEVISDGLFTRCAGLTAIDFSRNDKVKSIEKNAFRYCTRLSSAVLPPNLITIGDSAFEHCGELRSITIPASVKTIGKGALFYCDKLEHIDYAGTEDQWKEIQVGDLNSEVMKRAEIVYCSQR